MPTKLANAIAERVVLCDVDELPGAIQSVIDDALPALLSAEVFQSVKDGTLYLMLPPDLSPPARCKCDGCKADPRTRRENALAIHANSSHAWKVHFPRDLLSAACRQGNLKRCEKRGRKHAS